MNGGGASASLATCGSHEQAEVSHHQRERDWSNHLHCNHAIRSQAHHLWAILTIDSPIQGSLSTQQDRVHKRKIMKLIDGLLDYSKHWERPDIYLFTGNATIKKDGAIVMGRGAAKQCRDLFPGVDQTIGGLLAMQPKANLLFAFISPGQWLGWFKVKEHWSTPARIDLIERSTAELKAIAEAKPKFIHHMNYPGVGNGRLDESMVQPILDTLPDNVWIYR
jgi:hypothetical protein